jgi:eukaryotic-like serine/threonine-protein kinase
MPAPATSDELLDLVQKSGVVEEPKLRAYVQKLTESSGVPREPAKLAGLLVRDGVLTYFQAEQILQGKYKRFSLGKYKVLEKLGAGGMAQVFLCEHKLMRRRVAIKVLPVAKADDPSSLARFYREAKAIAAVDHPNIVRAYDIDQDENLHFLVMEYVDGINLQDLVKKFGPLNVVRACHYIYGAAVGLQHAHEIGLIHRDIKPGNILIDRAGVVKILDMGLARFFHDEDDILTKKYDENVLGTADYLAPEQALDSHTVDIRADIYSLGATFYFLLTGSAPFPEGTVPQKLIWHQNRPPRPLKSLRSEVPDELVAVVERMMMKDPKKRYQTPGEVMAALAPWVATPIPPPSEKEMPQVSPAAGGTTRAPATMVGARFGGAADSPTIIAPGTVGGLAPATAPTPSPHAATTPGPAVWESLDTDTQTLSLGDTDRPASPTTRPSRTGARPGVRRRTLLIAAALALLAAVIALYFAFFRGKKEPDPTPAPSGPRRIVVSKAGGEHTVATLREALTKATPGDTIVIAEPKLTEPSLRIDRTRHRDLTIESATPDGKPAVVEATGTPAAMLDIASVEGFRLRNVEFDGGGRAEVGIQVSGLSPGTMLEGVTVRNVKAAGFKVLNAAGETGHPILIDRGRVVLTTATQTGVLLTAANADTRRVTIHNVRVEGAGTGIGLRIDGASSDLELTENRFYHLAAAVSFAKPPTNKIVKAHFTANTVFASQVGLLFDLAPPAPPPAPPEPPMGKFELSVERNYFAKTAQIATSGIGPVAGVTVADNAHGPETAQGNFPIAVWSLTAPGAPLLPAPDPANDATFLRFPGGPPEIPPKNVKVGAP